MKNDHKCRCNDLQQAGGQEDPPDGLCAKGLNSADVIKIRVPTDNRQEIFVEPAEYARLENPTGYWTAANGDLIAKGVIEDEITRDTELKSRGYLAGVILSHSDNRRGSSPHIRIGGG